MKDARQKPDAGKTKDTGKKGRPTLSEEDLRKVSGGKGKKGSDGGTTQPPK